MCNRAVTSADQFNRQRTIKVQLCQLEEFGVTENRSSGTKSICWHLINIWIWVWWKDERANEQFFFPTDWLWLWGQNVMKVQTTQPQVISLSKDFDSEIKILLHQFEEDFFSLNIKNRLPPTVFECICTCTVTDRILTRCFSVSLCGLHTSSASVCACYTLSPSHSHNLNSCARPEEPGHTSPPITHIPGVSPPAVLRLKQRGHEVCLKALCYCHNGQDFAGICPFITAH